MSSGKHPVFGALPSEPPPLPPQGGIMAGMPPADVVRAHMAALNNLTDAINRLAQAFRTTFDQVRYEAYGQGRDDEAANLDLRYTNPRSKP